MDNFRFFLQRLEVLLPCTLPHALKKIHMKNPLD